MVEGIRLIVNGQQFRANGYFLGFNVIFVGKFAYDKVNIRFVRLREWKLNGGFLDVTQ